MLSAFTESAFLKSFPKSFARAAASVVAAAALAAVLFAPVVAQNNGTAVSGRLRLDSLERLAPKAVETVNVEIDGFLINFDVEDRKSTRLNSSHRCISYAVFCL